VIEAMPHRSRGCRPDRLVMVFSAKKPATTHAAQPRASLPSKPGTTPGDNPSNLRLVERALDHRLAEDDHLVPDDPRAGDPRVWRRSPGRSPNRARRAGPARRAPDQPRSSQRGRLRPNAEGVWQLAPGGGTRRGQRAPGAAQAAGPRQAHRAGPRRRPPTPPRARHRPRPGDRIATPRHRPAGVRGGRNPPRRPAAGRLGQGHGQGAKERIVPIGTTARGAIVRYLGQRGPGRHRRR
jgi:hypothetical protein